LEDSEVSESSERLSVLIQVLALRKGKSLGLETAVEDIEVVQFHPDVVLQDLQLVGFREIGIGFAFFFGWPLYRLR